MCYTSLIPVYNSSEAPREGRWCHQSRGVAIRALSSIPSSPVEKKTFSIGLSTSKAKTALLPNLLGERWEGLCEGHLKSKVLVILVCLHCAFFLIPYNASPVPWFYFTPKSLWFQLTSVRLMESTLPSQQACPAANFMQLNQNNRINNVKWDTSELLKMALNSNISYSPNLTSCYKIITLNFSLFLVGSELRR